ncbi:MAG TPA: DnaJ C-terminal domain-containing protein, partial [Spirochaetota bacterium]|nr:DnaJ C-terminal domain-containing protein [Spirochaetota bacterium]
VIHVQPHRWFERHEDDLICEVPISIAQAALGAEILVPTLDEKRVKLKIPAGTQNDTILRVRGQGVPQVNRSGRGDLLVKIIVRIPESLSGKQKQILKDFAAASNDTDAPQPSDLFAKRKARY